MVRLNKLSVAFGSQRIIAPLVNGYFVVGTESTYTHILLEENVACVQKD